MKTLKTSDIVSAYRLLNGANLNGMNGAAKIAVVKNIKALKPIAVEFDEFYKSAIEKLKGENHDAMVELAEKWSDLSDEQKKEVNDYFIRYNKQVRECIMDEDNKEHDVDTKSMSEDDFEKLVGNNDWNADQIISVENTLLNL